MSHRWELNKCVQCGLERKSINRGKVSKGTHRCMTGYSYDGFKTVKFMADECKPKVKYTILEILLSSKPTLYKLKKN